jgi:hypothetical protein
LNIGKDPRIAEGFIPRDRSFFINQKLNYLLGFTPQEIVRVAPVPPVMVILRPAKTFESFLPFVTFL